MKHNIQQIGLTLTRIDRRYVQLILAILALALLILAAGAPEAGGGLSG